MLPLIAHCQLLYQISGKGAQSKSYLFATNKYVELAFLDSVPNLFQKYASSKRIITEMEVDSIDLTNLLLSMASQRQQRLSDVYSHDEQQIINKTLQDILNLSLQEVELLKPAFLTELIRHELLQQHIKRDIENNSELFFQSIAMEDGKEVIALDNMQETLQMLFAREPEEWQQKELLKLCQNTDKEIQQEMQITALYRLGRINQINYQVIMPDNTSTVSYSDYQVFANRNLRWAKCLEPYLQEGGCFICLDAIYIGGDKGLLAALRQQGYRVKAVNR